MSWLYRTCLRPVLFAQDSESIHNLTVKGLGEVSRRPLLCDALASFLEPPDVPMRLWNLSFPNPVGLAAGMDKEAEALPAWQALGFGFCELGAVTWHPQPGNPMPRVFRAIADEALVNRMGFNNAGAKEMAESLARWRLVGRWPSHPVGINLGKSKVTPLDQAPEDYANSLHVLWPHLDFFVVNVSSPNTPNLRQLQDKTALDEILGALREVNHKLAARETHTAAAVAQGESHPGAAVRPGRGAKPILVKIAPDLSFEAIDEILELVVPRDVAGIVATNTTIARPQTDDALLARIYSEAGGLSGKPLRSRSTEVVRHLWRQSRGALPIIGVGGIFTADDAWEKIRAGASLVQVYTGLVYEGPGVVRAIVTGLQTRLAEAGLQDLSQAVGMDS